MLKLINKSTLSFALLAICSLFLFTQAAAAKDSDNDGLSNKREEKIGTNPRKADTDSDALRDGREVKRTRTNPLKADTDSDALRDGREVNRTGTNPRDPDSDDDGVEDGPEVSDGLDPSDPDSDNDGAKDIYERKGRIEAITEIEEGSLVTVRTKRKTIFQVRVDSKTFLEGLDRDANSLLTVQDFQAGDRVEVNLDPADPQRAQTLELQIDDDEDNEWKGRISEITGSDVTVTNRGGVSKTFAVDIDTFLRAPDRDSDGMATINDLLVGDKVEAHLSEDGARALALEVEYSNEYDDHDGYEQDGDEVEGILVPGFTESSLTIIKRGYERTILIDANTEFFGDDRNSDGVRDVADLIPGDKIEARIGPDGSTASAVEYKLPGDDQYIGGGDKREEKGVILSMDPLLIGTVFGPFSPLPDANTEYDVPDRNLDGSEDLADFQAGDFVEVKFRVTTGKLLEMELMRPPGGGEEEED